MLWKMFFEFLFLSSKMYRNERTIMLKDWPLKTDSNCPYERGQTNTQIQTVFYIVRFYLLFSTAHFSRAIQFCKY